LNWRPDTEGLNRDAVLFAAGLAAAKGQRGRLFWPAVSTAFAMAVVALGVWALNEHRDCQLLLGELQILHEREPFSSSLSTNALAAAHQTAATVSPNSYFSLRKQLEKNPSQWLASQAPIGPAPLGTGPPEPSILRASQYEALLSQ